MFLCRMVRDGAEASWIGMRHLQETDVTLVETEQYEGASIEIIWTGCNEAVLKYDIPTLELSGEVPIQRIVLDHVAACLEAQAP